MSVSFGFPGLPHGDAREGAKERVVPLALSPGARRGVVDLGARQRHTGSPREEKAQPEGDENVLSGSGVQM
jgi:hypothetical protein